MSIKIKYHVRHVPTEQTLATDLIMANNFFLRLRGLLFRPMLQENQGIIITPCQQIHTHFMTYALDVVFLDEDYRVCYTVLAMKPWRFTKYIRAAKHVLELPKGAANNIKLGDRLELVAQS